jgi:hypothetical protein
MCVCVRASPHVQRLVNTICPICGFCHADNGRNVLLQLQFNYPTKKLFKELSL